MLLAQIDSDEGRGGSMMSYFLNIYGIRVSIWFLSELYYDVVQPSS